MRFVLMAFVMATVLLVGCSVPLEYVVIEFDDTGDDVENVKLCYERSKIHCDNNWRCTSIVPGESICNGEICVC